MTKPQFNLTSKKSLFISSVVICTLIAIFSAIHYYSLTTEHLTIKDLTLTSHQWLNSNTVIGIQQENNSVKAFSINPDTGEHNLYWEKKQVASTRWLDSNTLLLALKNVRFDKGHIYILDLNKLTLSPFFLPFYSGGYLTYNQDRNQLAYLPVVDNKYKLVLYSLAEKKIISSIHLDQYTSTSAPILGMQWLTENTAVILAQSPFKPIYGQVGYLVNTDLKRIISLQMTSLLSNPEFLSRNKLITYRPDYGLVYMNLKDKTEQQITSTINYADLSYTWVNDSQFVYYEIISKNQQNYDGKLYLVELSKLNKHKLITTTQRQKTLYPSPVLLISPDQNSVSFINPDHHLEICGL